MCTRVSRRALCIALACLVLAGCGWQAAQKAEPDVDLLAVGPDQEALSIPPDYVSAAIDAAGGLSTWMQTKERRFAAVVTIYADDGSFYLTEHDIVVYPWSNAITVSSDEPRSTFIWQVVDGQYDVKAGDARLDVSPRAESYRDYAEALLQIATAPARLLAPGIVLSPRPAPVKIQGQWYQPVEARFPTQKVVLTKKGEEQIVALDPYWTHGVYYQNRQSRLVDLIWLGNPARQRFLLVRGYDYAPVKEDGVLAPTKIELFRTDQEETFGDRLFQVDVKP